jgi:hypothetical protein
MKSTQEGAAKEYRPPGLLVLSGIVVLGLGSGAAYYHYKQPMLAAELQEKIDAAPKTLEGRLAAWHAIGAPQIHHRLSKFARFTPELPWLVTHAVVFEDGGPPELWGIDCDTLPQRVSKIEGMSVVIDLPAPRALGRYELVGDMVRHVQSTARDSGFDGGDRLKDIAIHLLEGMPAALEKDIEGARIRVRINDRP